MDKKNLAIISYITIFGWLYVYFTTNNAKRDSLVKYHLKQFFGLFIISIIFNVVLSVLAHIIPALSFLSYLGLAFLLLWVFGLINAVNAAEKPIPVIGKIFEDKFDFIK